MKFKANFEFIEKEDIEEEIDEKIKNENELSEKNLEPEEIEKDEEKNEINEEKQENVEDEENNHLKRKLCTIGVELFKYENGFLLRFLRESGKLEDFYTNLKNIYTYAEGLL